MALEKDLDTEIGKKFKSILLEQLGIIGLKEGDIKIDSNFYSLGADDIDLMEMRMAVEETYRIDISNEDAQKILTVGQAIDYISKQINDLAEKPGPWRDFVNRLT